MMRVIRQFWAVLVILGFIASPVHALSMKSLSEASQSVSLATAQADEMPCHSDEKRDSNKSCPCMALCVALSFAGMPPVAEALARPATLAQSTPILNFGQLPNLASDPPARPPRA